MPACLGLGHSGRLDNLLADLRHLAIVIALLLALSSYILAKGKGKVPPGCLSAEPVT